MTLGQRICQYRKQLNISQEELGDRLGVSRQAVSKWETDLSAPDMNNLLALACGRADGNAGENRYG